ncbi:AI-2E family transporter [Methanocaldococcus sp.]
MNFDEFKYIRKAIVIGLLLVLLYIVFPFIDTFAYACAFAYMALPIYNLLVKKLNRTVSAALAIGIYLIPITLITIYAFSTFLNIVLSIDPNSINQYFLSVLNNPLLDRIITNDEMITKYVNELIKYAISQLSGKIIDVGYLAIKTILVLFITFYFLRDGYKFKDVVISFTPENYKEKMKIYLQYLHDSYKNLFISCVSLSIIITILSYIGYLIAGVKYAELFAIITGVFALLPILGGWMVYIAIAIYFFLTHNYAKAIFIFVYGELFLSIAPDFVIRPYIVKKEVDIHPVLVVVAFLIAPLSLGLSGFAIGPLVVGALNAFYLAKYRDKKI